MENNKMIITISREFGSGGRELGKRLSDALNIPCYDKEIIALIAKEDGSVHNLSRGIACLVLVGYVHNNLVVSGIGGRDDVSDQVQLVGYGLEIIHQDTIFLPEQRIELPHIGKNAGKAAA